MGQTAVFPVLRNRDLFTQAALFLLSRQHTIGGATSLHGRYPASSLSFAPPTPGMPRPGYVFPLALGSTHMSGSPRSINQSFGARCPQSPRQARWLLMLVASPPMAGFSISGRLATCIGVTRPNRVHLRYGSHLHLRRLRRSDYSDLTHTTLRRLHVERAIHMASSFHLAELATAWRTRGTEAPPHPDPLPQCMDRGHR